MRCLRTKELCAPHARSRNKPNLKYFLSFARFAPQTNHREISMRTMCVRSFPRPIKISDFEHLVRTRIREERIEWPEQAFSLIGYMAWPNDPENRAKSVRKVQDWQHGSKAIPKRLLTIQRQWLRVGDIFQFHRALTAGGHQQRRGGPSVGKGIELAHVLTKSRGARKSNLWRSWTSYRDVAHLVAAAAMIGFHAQLWAKIESIGKRGPLSDRLQPFQIALLMPEFVIAVALSLQEYGLSHLAEGSDEPMLNRETLWRIPADINVTPVQPPERHLNKEELAVLSERRAGNRGRKRPQH